MASFLRFLEQDATPAQGYPRLVSQKLKDSLKKVESKEYKVHLKTSSQA